MVELRDRALDQWRTEHLYRDGLASPADGPEIIQALLDLRSKGCPHDAMKRAGQRLRARDCRGQFLVVADDVVLSEFHHCFWADAPLFEGSAWVVRVAPAEEVEP